MGFITNRIIWSDNGVLKDLSIKLNDPSQYTVPFPFVASEDSLYIGSEFPFPSRYYNLTAFSSTASSISISLWNGSAFEAAVDVLDETAPSTASMSQSGTVYSRLDKGKVWGRSDTGSIPALSTLKIFDLYWAKVNWSADLSAGTILNYIGFKFADDQKLSGIYSELGLSNTKEQFEAGKTNWDEQLIIATEFVLRDLKSGGHLVTENQVLDPSVFSEATCHLAAKIIFTAFGDDYKDNRETAMKDYKDALAASSFKFDRNFDTRLQPFESLQDISVIRR